MKLADIVAFRKDLLFSGAVQLGWLESNEQLADKAASHYAFHGPSYHGLVREPLQDEYLRPVDTASFTLDIIERITGRKSDEPFALAIAGYGTGKSHLAVTLASLLGAPGSELADRILRNLCGADREIGGRTRRILSELQQPFLTIAINGMKDFDLTAEIVRQVLLGLRKHGLDTSPLEDLRPRFKYAINFTESLFDPLQAEYEEAFGPIGAEEIVERLRRQDEEAFERVSAIYERKTGAPFRAVGQESLHDLVRVARETYCGEGKPFAGMLILFDEFGRYLEFSVQRPQMAGPGALQQLFEAVQANAEGVFLLSFIQYELRAYISRIAPELRDDLQRYVTRYDVVQKVRLSTNLETLIANLLEKRDRAALEAQVASQPQPPAVLHADMKRWFPELESHAIWNDLSTFRRVIVEGCWPLHPLSTWLLYRLTSVGRSLQQRSALSLLADAYNALLGTDVHPGFSIAPVDLCTDALIDEFLAAEKSWQQGAAAHAYWSVLARYQHQLDAEENRTLRAVLLMGKMSIRTASKEDFLHALALFAGRPDKVAAAAMHSLESEKGALSWNEALQQYEIVGDAVPRAEFVAYLDGRVAEIPALQRAQLFSENYARWFPDLEIVHTDFGAERQIATREWRYQVSFASVHLLPNQIEHAFRNWLDARAVDVPKGQLIYCYVGAESDLSTVREAARARLRTCLERAGLDWQIGAPIAISFLHDDTGALGAKVAEYWLLQQRTGAEANRYANYILERQSSLQQELRNLFESLSRQRHMIFASGQEVRVARLADSLSRLFAAVYSHHIPFPFDGFSTATGNAAKDCSLFTRELFLGHLDRDWITARPPRQRNRAVAVLDDSWGALDNAGALRVLPANETVRRIVDLLHSQLTAPSDPQPLNLGQALRALCLPPYGCSLASAGMVLALFLGARKGTLDLYRDGRLVGAETWLQAALPRNYLEPSVLDDTTVVKVSAEAVSEWNLLLNAWEIETTHQGRLNYRQKARELAERIPAPQSIHYQYDNLRLRTRDSLDQLRDYDTRLNAAFERVEAGVQTGDVGQLSWGAAELARLRATLDAQREEWTEEQIRLVEQHEARARIETQERFARWLARQSAESAAQLSDILRLLRLVAGNLDALGLSEEQAALKAHAEALEEHKSFLERVHRLQSDVVSFTRTNRPNASTDLRTIEAWLGQIAGFEATIGEAQGRQIHVPGHGLEEASAKLARLRQACSRQADEQRERALAVYNAEIRALGDIRDLQSEVTALRQVFAGQERDLGDFEMIRRQLDSLEDDYRKLDSDTLSDSEFEALVSECMAATEAEFGEDEPPLDSEAAYQGIAQTIRARRQQSADTWMRAHVPQKEAVLSADAQRALDIRAGLRSVPRYLNSAQMEVVRQVAEACDRRLDELEIEGLVARYQALPDPGKQAFLARIAALESGQPHPTHPRSTR